VTAPLLEARDITVVFGRGAAAFEAVKSAHLQVEPAEAIGIVGESGSGKTTLARVLVGLQMPAAGEVFLEGQPIFGAETRHRFPRARRWSIQMVFQDPYSSLNPRQRAWEAVAEAVHVWQGLRGEAAKAAALQLLLSMGISQEQAQQFPKALSGGQRQRVSVARALAPQPRVLIADEPTSSIDQSAQAQLLNLLRRLQQERGLAVIFISHDLGLVRYLTSRVYVMQKGSVVEAGGTVPVFERPQHEYTQLLISSIPGRGRETPAGLNGDSAPIIAEQASLAD
jgi:ABC-type dipeptide/oligopeptide/nickel transport system ATPase subunit